MQSVVHGKFCNESFRADNLRAGLRDSIVVKDLMKLWISP
jgi:hypothetical protein